MTIVCSVPEHETIKKLPHDGGDWSEEVSIDYKSTINLPQTDLAMKADLARREPAMLAEW